MFGMTKCVHCGNKTFAEKDLKYDQRLMGNEYLCENCRNLIPRSFRVYNAWPYAFFASFLKYREYAKSRLEPVFRQTYEYGDLLLDEVNGIFKHNDTCFEIAKLDRYQILYSVIQNVYFEYSFQTYVEDNITLGQYRPGKNAAADVHFMKDVLLRLCGMLLKFGRQSRNQMVQTVRSYFLLEPYENITTDEFRRRADIIYRRLGEQHLEGAQRYLKYNYELLLS